MWWSANTLDHFPQQRVRTNTIVYIISQDHREGSVILPHKMLYFHRKNGNLFVNYKINIYLTSPNVIHEQTNLSKTRILIITKTSELQSECGITQLWHCIPGRQSGFKGHYLCFISPLDSFVCHVSRPLLYDFFFSFFITSTCYYITVTLVLEVWSISVKQHVCTTYLFHKTYVNTHFQKLPIHSQVFPVYLLVRPNGSSSGHQRHGISLYCIAQARTLAGVAVILPSCPF